MTDQIVDYSARLPALSRFVGAAAAAFALGSLTPADAPLIDAEILFRQPDGQRCELGFIGCRAVKARVWSPVVVKI
jgi:hypothetical protein